MRFWCCAIALLMVLGGTALADQVLFGEDQVFTDATRGNAAGVEEFLLTGNNPNIRDRKHVPLIIYAAISGSEKTVLTLIKHSAQIDLADDTGNTALIQAAAYGWSKIITILLDHGADIDEGNRQGETALIKAAKGGHVAAARVLLEKGADPELADFTGRTPLDHARQSRNPEMIHLMEKAAS
ncbi:MAG: ankyrin repeat domain-containing protein [Alphaproteobacteria bacterium]|nr:MAG: ankyrin repeat domain-containing protein [Alphaproteobacteria bacterium]